MFIKRLPKFMTNLSNISQTSGSKHSQCSNQSLGIPNSKVGLQASRGWPQQCGHGGRNTWTPVPTNINIQAFLAQCSAPQLSARVPPYLWFLDISRGQCALNNLCALLQRKLLHLLQDIWLTSNSSTGILPTSNSQVKVILENVGASNSQVLRILQSHTT